MNKSIEVAKILQSCEAIFINTKEFFTYSSGIKSPIYCDNRVLISHVNERKIIANYLAQMIQERYGEVDYIAATATGAIAHGAWVADVMQKPLLYILSKNKTHGRKKLIEGSFSEGKTCVVLEDLISSGNSSIAAVESARKSGLKVKGVAAIFSYELNQASKNFAAIDCEFCSLSGFSAFKHMLSSEELAVLEEWRNSQN